MTITTINIKTNATTMTITTNNHNDNNYYNNNDDNLYNYKYNEKNKLH